MARRPQRPVVRGELNPIFQGTYSSRIELKQRTRELERLLTTAEKLGAMLRWLGMPADEDVLWRAWEPMLFNQTHDLMSGVMTDRVYEDTIRGYDFSQRIADGEVQARLQSMSTRIDTQGEGIPVVVFNMLGWPRTDIALASVGFSQSDVKDLGLVGPDGQAVPVQVFNGEHYAGGGLLRAEIAFVARDVPAMGYSVYRLLPRAAGAGTRVRAEGVGDSATGPHPNPLPKGEGTSIATAAKTRDEPVLENEQYRVEFDPAGGAITRLIVKPEQWNALSGPGNVVAREEDHGDLWELYHTLNGGSAIAMKTQSAVPQAGKALFSSATARHARHGESRPGRLRVHRSAIPSARRASSPPRSASMPDCGGSTSTRKIVNNDRFVRYRALFPTSLREGRSVHEIPFGAIGGPSGIELPAQNWIDYGNGRRGLALLNRGLPGNVVSRWDADAVAPAEHADRGLWGHRRLRSGHVVRFRFRVGPGTRVRLRPGPPCRRLAAGRRLSRWPGVQSSAAGPHRGLASGRAAQALGVPRRSLRRTSWSRR